MSLEKTEDRAKILRSYADRLNKIIKEVKESEIPYDDEILKAVESLDVITKRYEEIIEEEKNNE